MHVARLLGYSARTQEGYRCWLGPSHETCARPPWPARALVSTTLARLRPKLAVRRADRRAVLVAGRSTGRYRPLGRLPGAAGPSGPSAGRSAVRQAVRRAVRCLLAGTRSHDCSLAPEAPLAPIVALPALARPPRRGGRPPPAGVGGDRRVADPLLSAARNEAERSVLPTPSDGEMRTARSWTALRPADPLLRSGVPPDGRLRHRLGGPPGCPTRADLE